TQPEKATKAEHRKKEISKSPV
ncbi:unnamed protein product, partial [Allacma fusca]